MAQLYQELKPKSKYYDKKYFDSKEQYERALEVSSTVYVGNLSFFCSQDSIYELFSRCGQIVDIKVGINDVGHPCGFCFVIYENHEDARRAVEFVSGTMLCNRVIRVDWDPGYKEGREKGRGSGGQQKRDDFRVQEDADRPVQKRASPGGSHNNRYRGRSGSGPKYNNNYGFRDHRSRDNYRDREQEGS